MQEFSKYRVITAGIILMFVFAIAAIYTNTKDAAEKKMQKNNNTVNEQQIPQAVVQDGTAISNPDDITTSENNVNNNETGNQILQITERIDELERKVFAPQNNDNDKSVRCMVQGIISDGHIIPLSSQDAVNESRTSGKEVLITCVFK